MSSFGFRFFARIRATTHVCQPPLNQSRSLQISSSTLSSLCSRIRIKSPAVELSNTFNTHLLQQQPLNSTHHSSILRHSPTINISTGTLSNRRLRLDRPVHSRLSVHTRIHALLRHNRILEAARETEVAMDRNMRVHGRTFASVYHSLVPVTHRLIDTKDKGHADLVVRAALTGHKSAKKHMGQATASALSLLRVARQNHYRRSSWMYDRLIDLCLFQGEILTAALLFMVLVRDWLTRNALRDTTHQEPHRQSVPQAVQSNPLQRFEAPSRLTLPEPKDAMLHRICGALTLKNSSIAEGRYAWPNKPSLSESYEALAILVSLFDNNTALSHTRISDIHLLCRLLSDVDPDNPNYQQCQTLLDKFCQHITLRKPVSTQRPLSKTTHDVLLRYSLRHRKSPSLALSLLDSCRKVHPLDLTTWSIIHREASMMGVHSVVNRLNAALKEKNPSCPWLAQTSIDGVEAGTEVTLSKKDSSAWKAIVSVLLSRPIPTVNNAFVTNWLLHALRSNDHSRACRIIALNIPILNNRRILTPPELRPLTDLGLDGGFWAACIHAAASSGNLALMMNCWQYLAYKLKRVSDHSVYEQRRRSLRASQLPKGVKTGYISLGSHNSMLQFFLFRLRDMKTFIERGRTRRRELDKAYECILHRHIRHLQTIIRTTILNKNQTRLKARVCLSEGSTRLLQGLLCTIQSLGKLFFSQATAKYGYARMRRGYSLQTKIRTWKRLEKLLQLTIDLSKPTGGTQVKGVGLDGRHGNIRKKESKFRQRTFKSLEGHISKHRIS